MPSKELNFFILAYNRTDNIPTLNILRKYGINKNIFIVVGKDDPQIGNYANFDGCKILVFDKADYVDKVDSIGTYKKTNKICTYARAFVDDYAVKNGLKYICLLFDDIESIQIRYIEDGMVKSNKDFDLLKILIAYTDLLDTNEHIYMVGPPGSACYIGCKPAILETVAPTHYANIIIYDATKPIGPYTASVLEDMYIILTNAMIGHIGLFPYGLQVNCRKPQVTNDAYQGISRGEYLQHFVLLTRSIVNAKRVSIPYSKFIPKIISGRYRKE